MTKGYDKRRTCVYLMNYHFVWCPLYRRKVLVGKIAERLKELIVYKVELHGGKVLQVSIQPDHVHLFMSLNPTMAPNQIIGKIKGMTANVLRDEFPELKKRKSMWTRSYFVSTAGDVSSGVIERYILEQ